jgi:hypothetical protein
MAKYLSNIDLNKNQLQNAALHPVATTPATPVEGQVYFDTTVGDKMMYFYDGTGWVAMGSQGDITGVTAGTYLNGGGTSGDVEVNHDLTSRTDTTSSASPAAGGTFTAIDSVTSNSTGHITALNLKTVTLPADTNTTSLPVKNSAGTTQFTSTDVTGIRFTGTGSTTVSFTAGTQLVTIDSGNETITLTGEVTGSGTTSISTTVADGVLDINNFTAATIVTEAEGIANNDNDTTLPTSAAVKDYVDSSIVGGLVYQGGYNAATNTPDLDVSPSASIKTGWTYTVTADGTFFTEQVRVGDVLIAEVDAPTGLADWTTVQNNIDLATTTTVGIASFSSDNFAVSAAGQVTIKNDGVILGTETTGNYVATIGEGAGIDVTGSGSESAAVTVTLDLNELTIASTPTHLSGNDTSGNTRKFTMATVADAVSQNIGATGVIEAGNTSGIVTHALGTNVIVQTFDASTGDTVFCDVDRTSSTLVTVSINSAYANNITILVIAVG